MNGIRFHVIEEIFSDIFGVSREGVTFIEKVVPTTLFFNKISKPPNLGCAGVSKKIIER